jgi:hypothetical protein
MPRFSVTVEEINVYILDVEADNVEEASSNAVEDLINTDDSGQYFSHTESRKVKAAFPA